MHKNLENTKEPKMHKHPLKVPVFISFEAESLEEKASHIADLLHLPLLKKGEFGPEGAYLLYLTFDRLELRLGGKKGSKTKIFAEFVSGTPGFRRRFGGGLKEQLAKAVGLKRRAERLKILDVTAGLGQDAFVLASLGCEVILVERSPIVSILLKDGLARAEKDPEVGSIVRESMTVIEGEACEILEGILEGIEEGIEEEDREGVEKNLENSPKKEKVPVPDVVYLDPMFPKRTKQALTKIEMRVIRDIVGEDEDAAEVLLLAKRVAALRVVVKRPRLAPPLADLPPNFVVEGSRNRYDVYLSLRAKDADESKGTSGSDTST